MFIKKVAHNGVFFLLLMPTRHVKEGVLVVGTILLFNILWYFYFISFNNVYKQPEFCSDLEKEAPQIWKMTNNFSKSRDITYTSQASVEFFDRFYVITEYWKGPIAIAVFFEPNQVEQIENWKKIYCSNKVYERTSLAFLQKEDLKYNLSDDYAINELRNFAWNLVETEFTFVVDIDHIPLPNSYQSLKKTVSEHLTDPKMALIIPPFENSLTKNFDIGIREFIGDFPVNKSELCDLFRTHEFGIFHAGFFPAYGPIKYPYWFTAEEPYPVKYEAHFEPYVIIRTEVKIRFWELFAGKGFNYSSWTFELASDGFNFLVLPDIFQIHWPHSGHNGLTSGFFQRMKVSFASHMYSKNQSLEFTTAIDQFLFGEIF